MIEFGCSKCSRQLTVAESFAGTNGQCIYCGSSLTIPTVEEAESESQESGATEGSDRRSWGGVYGLCTNSHVYCEEFFVSDEAAGMSVSCPECGAPVRALDGHMRRRGWTFASKKLLKSGADVMFLAPSSLVQAMGVIAVSILVTALVALLIFLSIRAGLLPRWSMLFVVVVLVGNGLFWGKLGLDAFSKMSDIRIERYASEIFGRPSHDLLAIQLCYGGYVKGSRSGSEYYLLNLVFDNVPLSSVNILSDGNRANSTIIGTQLADFLLVPFVDQSGMIEFK